MEARVVTDGAHGSHGSNGYYGSSGGMAQQGGNGGRGGDGGHGQSAVSISMTATVHESSKVIQLDSNLRNFKLDLGDPNNSLTLNARGGTGGNGGAGGCGGSGGSGYPGQDATRYSSGTNGGRGGNGGNGGDGGHAGNGGDGGQIDLYLHERDMDVLILLKKRPSCLGGGAGVPGAGGAGGCGGAGGRGGSSYTWTESYTVWHTAGDGSRYCTTGYTTHSNPGGSNGPSGISGLAGRTGMQARPGISKQFTIHITGERNDVARYPWRYDLEVTKIRYASQKGDSIVEPGCLVDLYPSHRNSGECPTPSHQDILAYLAPTQWVLGRVEKVPLIRSIPIGAGQELGRPLVFEVVNVDQPTQGDPLRATGVMDHRALVDRVNVEFEGVKGQTSTFPIQYPVELQPIRSASTIALCEEAPMVIKVTNCSTQDLGCNSQHGRVLRVRIGMAQAFQIPNDIEAVPRKDFVIRTERGEIIDGPEMVVEIPLLKASSSTFVNATVAFTPVAQAYTFAVVCTSLDLGDIKNYKVYKTIQQRVTRIQLSESYAPDPKARFVLATNNRTTKAEVQAWRDLAEALDTSVAVYNVSLYQGLRMEYRRISDNQSLLDDLSGRGTLIVLNNECRDCNGEEKRSPYYQYCGIYPLQLAQQYRIHVMILGSMTNLNEQLLLPLLDRCTEPHPAFLFRSPGHFLKTGLDRVPYQILQTERTSSVFYSSSVEKTSKQKRLSRRSSSKLLRQSIKRPMNYTPPESEGGSASAPSSPTLKRSSVNFLGSARASTTLRTDSAPSNLTAASFSGGYVSVVESANVTKPAHMEADFCGHLYKKRKDTDRFRNVPTAGWQKRYFVLRKKDHTLSWYQSVTDKQPRGIIDLSDQFSCEVVPPEKEKTSFFTMRVYTDSRSLVMRTKSEEDFNQWMAELQRVKDAKSEKTESLLSKPIKSSASMKEPLPEGAVDDVFCGWAKRKGDLRKKTNFLMLRLHDRVLHCFKSDNLTIPTAVIYCHNARVFPGWKVIAEELPEDPESDDEDDEEELELSPDLTDSRATDSGDVDKEEDSTLLDAETITISIDPDDKPEGLADELSLSPKKDSPAAILDEALAISNDFSSDTPKEGAEREAELSEGNDSPAMSESEKEKEDLDVFTLKEGEEEEFSVPEAVSNEEEEAEVRKFTIVTPKKKYYFVCSFASQPSAQDWMERIASINEAFQGVYLSSRRYLSSVPERHALISATEKIIFFRKPKDENLKAHANSLSTALYQRYPNRRFVMVHDYLRKNADELRSGSRIRPEYVLGTLKVFETLSGSNPFLIIHQCSDADLHTAKYVSSQEIAHYTLSCYSFLERLDRLAQVDQHQWSLPMVDALISSVLAELANEIKMFSHSSKLSASQVKYGMTALLMFTQYDWCPLVDGALPAENPLPGTQLEGCLIEIIAGLKLILQLVFSLRNAFKDLGGVKKIIKKELRLLTVRVTRSYEKEQKKAFRETLKTRIKSRKDALKVHKIASGIDRYRCLNTLSFPHVHRENFGTLETQLRGFVGRPMLMTSEQYTSKQSEELNRPGQRCVVKENANKCDTAEDRSRLLANLQAMF